MLISIDNCKAHTNFATAHTGTTFVICLILFPRLRQESKSKLGCWL